MTWGHATDDYLNQLDGLLATDEERALELFCEVMDRAAVGQVVTWPDLYRAPGRITKVERLSAPEFPGSRLHRVHFKDGRWLEVIGASLGWPEEV